MGAAVKLYRPMCDCTNCGRRCRSSNGLCNTCWHERRRQLLAELDAEGDALAAKLYRDLRSLRDVAELLHISHTTVAERVRRHETRQQIAALAASEQERRAA